MSTIAVDFDGTLCRLAWPEIGEEVPGAVAGIRRLSEAGHELILWTCREDHEEHDVKALGSLAAAKDWLQTRGILSLFAGFNVHTQRNLDAYGNDCRKIAADYYIDDKALGCPKTPAGDINWPAIVRLFDGRASRSPMSAAEVKVVDPDTGGVKGTKDARFDLIPKKALWEVARLYGWGATKYTDHNWRRGYKWSLSVSAAYRHLALFEEGEDLDPESGLCHLSAVVFHALTLLTFRAEHQELDDRWKPRTIGE